MDVSLYEPLVDLSFLLENLCSLFLLIRIVFPLILN